MGGELKQETHITDVDMGHEAVHFLGDNFGYITLLGFIIVGAALIFRKKIKTFFGIK